MGNNFIIDIEPGSPAEKAGLQRGDQILSINGADLEARTRKTFLKGVEVFDKARGNVQFVVRYEPIYYNFIMKKCNKNGK